MSRFVIKVDQHGRKTNYLYIKIAAKGYYKSEYSDDIYSARFYKTFGSARMMADKELSILTKLDPNAIVEVVEVELVEKS